MNNEETPLPFLTRNVPEYVRLKAEIELNESQENIFRGLEQLKRLMKENNVTQGVLLNDDFLVQYLRVAKFNTCKAFHRIRNFIIITTKHKYFLKPFPDEYFQDPPWKNIFHIMPTRCPEGCVVGLIKTGNWDPDVFPLNDYKRWQRLIYMECERDPVTQICGIKLIFDLEGISFKHMRMCTPDNIYFLFHSIMQCLPVRWKEFHYVRDSFTIRLFWTLMKTLLTEKLKKRFFFHSKSEDLHEHFPSSVLPKEYGGSSEYWDHSDWLKSANKGQGKNPYAALPNIY